MKKEIIKALRRGLDELEGDEDAREIVETLMRASVALISEEKDCNAHEIYGVASQILHNEMNSFVELMYKLDNENKKQQ